jgi:hypothetical protein
MVHSTRFIPWFTGSHGFVLDYLVEEALHQQPESVQAFLLGTAVLDRLTGSLCDAGCTKTLPPFHPPHWGGQRGGSYRTPIALGRLDETTRLLPRLPEATEKVLLYLARRPG